MAEAVSPFLTAWSNFYIMIGSAAAALTGLMFVVITLLTRTDRAEDAHAAIATFSTPTVLHLVTALLVSAILIAPWRSLAYPGAVAALIGLYGVVHILRVMYRTRRLTIYTADLEDWIWYSILPLVAYGTVSGSGMTLAIAPVPSLFILAGGVVLLIFIGIRNAWDSVTYLVVRRP